MKEIFPPIADRLKKIAEEKIPALEKELNQLGAPWTPGRIPEIKE